MTTISHRDLAAEVRETMRGPVEYARVGPAGGPPALLLHGTPGNWRQLVPLAARLAERGHDVVMPSRPGYGRSPITSGRTPAEHAAAYAALLDELGITRPIAVVGVSGGGPSSVVFAETRPERTASLVLCCALAPHLHTPERAMQLLRWVPGVLTVVSDAGRVYQRRKLRDPAKVEARLQRELTEEERARLAAEPSIRDDVMAYRWSQVDGPSGVRGMANDLKSMGFAPHGRAPDLTGITAKTTILHGDADTVVPVSHAEFHRGAIAGSTLTVLEGAGHAFLLTFGRGATDLVAEAIEPGSSC